MVLMVEMGVMVMPVSAFTEGGNGAGGHGGGGGLTEAGVWKQNHTALIGEPEEQG